MESSLYRTLPFIGDPELDDIVNEYNNYMSIYSRYFSPETKMLIYNDFFKFYKYVYNNKDERK